jgi:hypothetical protein
VAANREDWEAVLRKVKAGEMPPPGVPKPASLAAMASYLEHEFDRLDKNVKPDPGRVTARRLNRAEYRNTIRDLLGVDFQTTQEFPVDDTGEGFDNIGDILSVSPLLTEKYLSAAESREPSKFWTTAARDSLRPPPASIDTSSPTQRRRTGL